MRRAIKKNNWVRLLIVLTGMHISVGCYGQTLTIYTVPAPHAFHWESPGRLMFSYLRNALSASRYGKYRHLLGHMMIELEDSTRHVIAGVCAVKNSGMTRKVIYEGAGLAILFAKVNGQLDETAYNLPDIQQRSKKGDIAFLRFRVSQPVFDRLWNYYSEYRANGYYRDYNGLNKPLLHEGAGCSAFVFSFLEAGGLLNMVPPEICRIERAVPPELIQDCKKHRPRISVFRLFFSRKWAAADEPGARLYSTYEPTWLYNWIRENHPFIPDKGKVQQSRLNLAPGIMIDCRDLPVPTGCIWNF